MRLAASTLGLPPFNHLYLLPRLRAIGIEASSFRARAYLADTPFDSAFAAERPPLPRLPESR